MPAVENCIEVMLSSTYFKHVLPYKKITVIIVGLAQVIFICKLENASFILPPKLYHIP